MAMLLTVILVISEYWENSFRKLQRYLHKEERWGGGEVRGERGRNEMGEEGRVRWGG